MKNYDPNYSWGIHIVEITLHQWQYKGKITVEIRGNCKGFSILEGAKNSLNEKKYTIAIVNLKLKTNGFTAY